METICCRSVKELAQMLIYAKSTVGERSSNEERDRRREGCSRRGKGRRGKPAAIYLLLFRRCDILVCHPAVPSRAGASRKWRRVRSVVSLRSRVSRSLAIDPRSTPMYTGVGSSSGRGRRARSWLMALEIASANARLRRVQAVQVHWHRARAKREPK